MNLVARPALLAAIIGPIQATLGWVISGALWPGFDHVTKTISDLAADDSPVKWVQSSFFVLGGTLSIVVAFYAPVFALAGRVVIFLSGITTYGLTFFAVPSQDSSSLWHRVFAIATFILMSAWPLFSMRFDRSYPWIVRWARSSQPRLSPLRPSRFYRSGVTRHSRWSDCGNASSPSARSAISRSRFSSRGAIRNVP
jgi:hypothetical protein